MQGELERLFEGLLEDLAVQIPSTWVGLPLVWLVAPFDHPVDIQSAVQLVELKTELFIT